MKRNLIGYLALLALIGLLPQPAHAGSAFKTFSGFGAGDITVGFTGCADITCPSGGCFCAEGTSIPFKAGGGIGAGTVHIEMLMNNGAQVANVAGVCEPGGGLAFYTAKNGTDTMTLGIAGTFCKTNPSFFSWATVTGGFNILSGAGKFSNAGGSGVFSFGSPILSETTTGPAQLQLTGSFNKSAPTTLTAEKSLSGADATGAP